MEYKIQKLLYTQFYSQRVLHDQEKKLNTIYLYAYKCFLPAHEDLMGSP